MKSYLTKTMPLAVALLFSAPVIAYAATHAITHTVTHATTTDQIVNKELERINDGQRSQQRVDTLADKTDHLTASFRNESKILDGLKIYNQQLQKQIDNQKQTIESLNTSIQGAAIIERQIVPLMVKMIDALEVFVSADLPFSLVERRQRVENLQRYMVDATVSAAERFRQVLEAYEIETAYGRSIETYTDKQLIGDKTLEVDMLRIGRVGLFYQIKNGQQSGVWDNNTKTWVPLSSDHHRAIRQAIRVAAKQRAPELLTLPVASPEGV